LKCGSGNTCLHRDWVDCGGGKSCAPGQVCVSGGSECLTRAQIADREAAEKRQKEEAKQAATAKQQQTLDGDCSLKKLQAIADGRDANSVICSDTVSQAPPKAAVPAPVTPSSQDLQWQKRLEYLKENQVRLHPPVTGPNVQSNEPANSQASSGVCSTFNDPSLPKGGCWAPSTTEEKADAQRRQKEEADRIAKEKVKGTTPEEKARNIFEAIASNIGPVTDNLELRNQKGLEYVNDSPQVQEAIENIRILTAAYGYGGKIGFEKANYLLTLKSVLSDANRFRSGDHYQATLGIINTVCSEVATKYGLPPGSPEVMNLAAAAATSYTYGFFFGT